MAPPFDFRHHLALPQAYTNCRGLTRAYNRECNSMHSLARTWLLAVLQMEAHGGRAKPELPHSKLAHPSPRPLDPPKNKTENRP